MTQQVGLTMHAWGTERSTLNDDTLEHSMLAISRSMVWRVPVVLAGIGLTAILGTVAAAPPAELDMRFRQFLLDESVVAQADGVRRVYGQFQPSGVRLIDVTEPVERGYVGRVLAPKVMYDAKAGKYRMWYQTITKQPDGSGGRTGMTLYAESDDLLAWRKPHLSNVDWRGDGKANNIVHDEPFNSVLPSPDGTHRLAGFAGGHSSHVYLMKDGTRVDGMMPQRLGRIPNSTEVRADAGRFNTDTYNIGYDPVSERYLGMIKTYSRLEESADPKLWRRAVAPAVSSDGSSWSYPKQQVLGVDMRDEARLLAHPHVAEATVPRGTFGPMAILNHKHFEGRTAADYPPHVELHDLMPFRYEGLYLGFRNHLYRYHIAAENRAGQPAGNYGEHSSEYFLSWSRDFDTWIRPDERTPLFPVPELQSDHFGCYRVGWPCLLRVGDELWLFYHVPVGYGNGPPVPPHEQWISYATLRVDGWAGYRAGKDNGVIETAPFVAEGKLHVNLDAGDAGSLRIEVLDEQRRVIPGFARSDCRPVAGDAPAAIVGWNANDWRELAGRRVRLRFHLEAATLYSFWTRGDDEIVGVQNPPPAVPGKQLPRRPG